MLRIANYTRKSVYVENSESIETQITLCKNYFQNKGECSVEVFEDEGFSGKNTNRPAFQRMMKEVKSGKFDVVAVYKVDRIARNIIDFVKIYDELEKYDVKLVSITEGFDASTPMGRMLMMILASFADMERANIAERVKDNLLQLAKKGAFTGGQLPIGCTSEKKDGKSYLVINDTTLIQTVFNIYEENGNIYATYKRLLELGYEIANKRTVRRILSNPIYVESTDEVSTYLSKSYEIIGSANGKAYMTYGRNVNEPIAIVGKHKPCISASQFLKVQKILDTNCERAKISSKDSKVHWLSGLIKCPECGGNYVLVSGRNHASYYVCTNRLNRKELSLDIFKEKCINKSYIKTDMLENKIDNLLHDLSDYNTFKKMYKQKKNAVNDIKLIENSIAKNEAAINNLIDKIALLSNSASELLLKKIEELTKKNSELKSSLETQKLYAVENEMNKENEKIVFNNILSYNTLKTPEEKKDKVRLIFESLVYTPSTDNVDINFL